MPHIDSHSPSPYVRDKQKYKVVHQLVSGVNSRGNKYIISLLLPVIKVIKWTQLLRLLIDKQTMEANKLWQKTTDVRNTSALDITDIVEFQHEYEEQLTIRK